MAGDIKILALGGDGIGPEVLSCALQVCAAVSDKFNIALQIEHDDLHGAAWDKYGTFCRDETLDLAKQADAVLVGAVGGPKWNNIRVPGGPEMQDGLMRLRKELDAFAGLRPARHWSSLANETPFREGVAENADILVLREMCGGVMFAAPRGQELRDDRRFAFDTAAYDDQEIARIAHAGFALARKRKGRLVSADKANVMESYVLWRQVFSEIATAYPDVTLSHMYADNCAYQIARDPKAFDVVVGCNFIGDFLSDLAAIVSASLGMLPSACLCAIPEDGTPVKGIYEPVHGSAPDIAGKGIANPVGTILSAAMMFRYSIDRPDIADAIERATERTVDRGHRTPDIGGNSTSANITQAIIKELQS